MEPPASPKPVTLRSIAERASISVSGVSLALRNHPSIPNETRRRVQKIAKELGYRPNPMVSTLMARIHTRRADSESPVLGMIFGGEFTEHYAKVPFYIDLLRGARDRAFQLGYRAEDMVLKHDAQSARTLHRALHAKNVRGVIIMPQSGGTECALSLEGLASCALGYTLHKPDLHRVVPNYEQGMRLAWRKLIERGYRRPGFVNTESHLAGTYYGRYGAFMAQAALHPKVDAIPPLVFPCLPEGADIDRCMDMFWAWFRRHRPDVLIFPPWGILEKLGKMIKIPDEAGVILADVESGWCQVKEDAAAIGSGAVDIVVAQIHRNETGVPANPKLMAINGQWVDGFSLPERKRA